MIRLFVQAQDDMPVQHSKEFSFTTENDAYLFQEKDAYYTNGIFLSMSHAFTKSGKKRIGRWELGQMIYTPLNRTASSVANIDRPYCGYLLLQYTQNVFYAHDAVWQWHTAFSELGQASLGEALQNTYHKLFHYSPFNGWQYQVQNAVGADLGTSFAKTLWEDSNFIKLVPQAILNIGTTFTNAQLGVYLCLGNFEKNSNSALWNARVQDKPVATRRNKEFFFYWYPQIIIQGYNGTVQGGLLNKGNSNAHLSKPETLMFQETLGLCFAEGRFTTKAAWVYQSREAITQIRAQQYGSLQLSYRLH